MKIIAAKSILRANDLLAAENRARLEAAGVLGVNLLGSPGAGKTTLLEALLRHLRGRLRIAAIEGDVAGTIDAERIEKLAVPVVQINTDGACHLDANMVARALETLELTAIDVLVIENVGNLVCTAGFDLGERLRLVVLGASEGDDKVVKYPAIFQTADALAITKADLLPHLDFQMDRVVADLRRLAPSAAVFPVAAIKGEGVAQLADWLAERHQQLFPLRKATE